MYCRDGALLGGFLGVSRSAQRAFLVFSYPSFLLSVFFIIVFVLGLYLVSFYIQFCGFFSLSCSSLVVSSQ